jgi:AcrR family transcriptional regulator
METSGGQAAPAGEDGTQADVKRRLIVDTAAALFDERGYHQTSIADLAAASGLAKPTFYHYFDSKSDVLREIHNSVDLPLGERMRARLESSDPAGELVRQTIQDTMRAMAEHRSHLRVFFEHHRELRPEDRTSVRVARRRYEDGLVEIIRRGVASGEFRDLDPQLTALAIFGLCNWSYQWLPRDVTVEQALGIAEQLRDLVFGGLLSTPASGGGGGKGGGRRPSDR